MLLLALSVVAWGSDGTSIAASARWHIDTQPRLKRADCSGLVESILARAGLPLHGNTASFWAAAEAEGRTHRDRPSPGDLVFWDRTYDRDRNGRLDDRLTHIGVVMAIDDDDTVRIAHRGTRTGVSEVRMNLDRPNVSRDADGRVLNSWLRGPHDRPEGPRLAGELFRGFASVVAPVRAPPVAVLRTRPAVPDVPADALQRVWDGRRVRRLGDVDCDGLWLLRNAVFARHGYRFRGERARATFDRLEGYEEDPLVDRWTVGGFLTRRDEANIEAIRGEERDRRCR